MSGQRFLALGLLAVWVFALALAIGTPLARLSAPPWSIPSGEGRSLALEGQTQVGQPSTAPFPGLSGIDVALDRAAVRGGHPVNFHLRMDRSAAEDLWTAELSTSDVQDSLPYSFDFPVIHDSQGHSRYFYLESTDSMPDDAIAAVHSPDAKLEGATAYLNGQPLGGSLQFQTFYTLRFLDKVDLLLARLAEGHPYLFGTRGFYAGLVVAYFLMMGLFLGQPAHVVLEEGRS